LLAERPNKALHRTLDSAGERQRSACIVRRSAEGGLKETIMWFRGVGCLLTLILSLLVAPLTTEAQQLPKVHRIGRLILGSPPAHPDPSVEAFRQGLHDLGYVEGHNLVLEYRYAESEARLRELATELVRLPVDVIVAGSAPAARAAQQATTTLPIVIITLTDPVSAGFVSNLVQPGGNITGVSGPGAAFIGKQFELLKDALPGLTRVAVLLHSAHPMASPTVRELERAARALGVQLHLLDVPGANALDTTLATLTGELADALLVPSMPMFFTQRKRILDFAAQRRLPVMATDRREWAEEGALMFYGVSYTANNRRAAVYVDKILKGAKPGDLPVEQPMQFALVLNLKTARALRITMPPSLLLLAEEVIQ
jgi:putative ABC transport system substrate-binding protein